MGTLRNHMGLVAVTLALAACSATVGGSTATDSGADSGTDIPIDAAVSCRLSDGTRCPANTTCPAGDGCNRCTCNATGALACTTLACAPACSSDADCPPGQGCEGPAGCGVPWSCAHLLCASIASTWCDCSGTTFTTTTACARRPYAHTGPCETPAGDAGGCTLVGAPCRWGDDCCAGYCPQRGAPISICSDHPQFTIGCNDRFCDGETEYCELTYSDTPMPDSSTCRPRLPACHDRPESCDCVPHPCSGCEQRSPGVFVFHCPGG